MGDPSKAPTALPPAPGGQEPGGGDRELILKVAVAVLAILLAGAIAGGIVILAGGEDRQAAAPATVTVSTKTEQAPTRTIERTTVVTQQANPAPAPATSSSASDEWPPGAGYTAILDSVQSRSEAESVKARAQARGLEAGILWSSNHSSLRPGWWAVFSGKFGTQPEAASRAAIARSSGFGDAYSRYVSN